MISQSVSRFGLWYSFIATANLLNPFSAWTCSDSHIKDSAHPTHQLPGIFTDAMSIRASPTSCLSYAVFPVTFTGVPRGLKRQRAHDSASSSSSGRFPFHHHHSIEVKCWKHYVIGQGKSKAGVQGQVTRRGRILLWEQVSRCNPTIRVFDRGLSLHGTNWLDLLLTHPPTREGERSKNKYIVIQANMVLNRGYSDSTIAIRFTSITPCGTYSWDSRKSRTDSSRSGYVHPLHSHCTTFGSTITAHKNYILGARCPCWPLTEDQSKPRMPPRCSPGPSNRAKVFWFINDNK